jgi:Protein of unknown function (DUF1266)
MDLPLWASPLWYVVPAAILGMMFYYLRGGTRQRLLAEFADERDPVKRWAKGVFGIITGGADYAHADKQELRRGLREWWGINNIDEFQDRFRALHAERPQSKPEVAWCWVRAVNLARMAAGAQLISQDDSWRLVVPFLTRIQRSFGGWEELGQSYLVAWEDWLREREISRDDVENVADSIEALREDVWRGLPFNQPLQLGQTKGKGNSATDEFRALWYAFAAAIVWAIDHKKILVAVCFVIAAVIVWTNAFRLGSAAEKDLVGNWLGELAGSGSLDGKRYDAQRFLMVIRPDRTATQTIRWYLGRQRQEEVVTRYEWTVSYEWGVRDLVWRRVCKQNPPGWECGSEAYRISIKEDELHYSSMGKGQGSTTMRKVAADYRLP